MKKYMEFAVAKAIELLAIDSPTGYTEKATKWIKEQFEALDFRAEYTQKGGLLVDLGGKNAQNAILLQAHTDTIGGMVCAVKGNGRLQIAKIGGLSPNNTETENVRIYTHRGQIYEGTMQLINPSTHVNGSFNSTLRTFENTEIVLDEIVSNAEEVKKLGIANGDIVCFEPRTRVTEKGYIKSRFLDDKLAVGIVLGFAKYLKEKAIATERKIWLHITVYEEVGHGAAATVPEGVTEVLSIDMGCVGIGLACTERQVSICAKDNTGPYNYEIVSALIAAAEKESADYALDVYPGYGSDADATLRGGHDVRHGLIGPGVYASHGYERSHKDGVENVLKVLKGYLC